MSNQLLLEKLQSSKRILIIGCPGSGKSYLATQLSKRMDIPLIHLDQHFHKPNWQIPDLDDWNRKVEKLCTEDQWIIDGMYLSSLPIRLKHAEFVIWLDLPKWHCIKQVFTRTVKYWKKKRPDAAEGCYERLDWEFVQFIWEWHYNYYQRITEVLRETNVPLLMVNNKNEMNAFFEMN